MYAAYDMGTVASLIPLPACLHARESPVFSLVYTVEAPHVMQATFAKHATIPAGAMSVAASWWHMAPSQGSHPAPIAP